MKLSNFNETSINPQQKDIVKSFFTILEKIAGKKVLNTQSDYDTLYDFSIKIRNHNEIDYTETENSINTIYLTEEQLEKFIQKIKPLTNGI